MPGETRCGSRLQLSGVMTIVIAAIAFRSLWNFLVNLVAGLITYTYQL